MRPDAIIVQVILDDGKLANIECVDFLDFLRAPADEDLVVITKDNSRDTACKSEIVEVCAIAKCNSVIPVTRSDWTIIESEYETFAQPGECVEEEE